MTTTAPVSGIIATKEDVESFADSCVLLRSQWAHFMTLFEGSDLKRELLYTTAPPEAATGAVASPSRYIAVGDERIAFGGRIDPRAAGGAGSRGPWGPSA